MIDSWVRVIATLFVICAAAISAKFYNHSGRPYAEGKEKQIKSFQSFRWIYRYLQVSTVIICIFSFWHQASILLEIHHSIKAMMVGLAISTMGLLLFIWARLSLGKHYSPCFDAFLPSETTKNGPYLFVRHPIYTGNLILLSGLFAASGSLWIAMNLTVVSVYYIRAAKVEEQILADFFSEYRTSMSGTGRFLPKVFNRQVTKF